MKQSKKYILLTGYGFIAKNLIPELNKQGYQIIHIYSKNSTKKKHDTSICTSYSWKQIFTLKDNSSILSFQLKSVIGIINFAGFPIAKRRWNKRIRYKIFYSRISTTNKLIKLLKQRKLTPSFFLQASSIGYYGNQEASQEKEETFTESSSSYQNTFLSIVCHSWEQQAKKIQYFLPSCRLLILRFGIVLSPTSPTWKKIYIPISKSLGFYIGNGKQFYSWVTLDDVISSIEYLIMKTSSKGIYNITSPQPISQKDMTDLIGEKKKKPIWGHINAKIIKFFLGDLSEELLLNSQLALPKRLEQEGYQFKYGTFKQAINYLLKEPSSVAPSSKV